MCQLVKLDHQLWARGSLIGPRVAPGPLWWGWGWGGGVKQDQADCPPCGAPPQGNKHTVGSGTA